MSATLKELLKSDSICQLCWSECVVS